MKIVGRHLAPPIAGHDIVLAGHEFHERVLRVGLFRAQKFFQFLNHGEGVDKAGCPQHPRLAARAAAGSHAVSAIKFIVARLNYDQIRIELEGLGHYAEHGITGNGHSAEIDDFDVALRPRVLQHHL